MGRTVLRALAVIGILAAGPPSGLGRLRLPRDAEANRLLIAGVAIAVGVGGVFALFWAMNQIVNWLPASMREGVRPYVFVGPALVLLSVFLVYPVINTLLLSFKDAAGRPASAWRTTSSRSPTRA